MADYSGVYTTTKREAQILGNAVVAVSSASTGTLTLKIRAGSGFVSQVVNPNEVKKIEGPCAVTFEVSGTVEYEIY